MIVIWKFPLGPSQLTFVSIPRAAEVRAVGLDPATGNPALWIQLDTLAAKVKRKFYATATGERIQHGHLFVGTIFHGEMVWHIHEVLS